MHMEFKILGALEVLEHDRDITPTAPKLRRVLSLLLLNPNKVVRTSTFIEELWGDTPVRSAMTTMQTYIYLLRKALASDGQNGNGRILLTKPAGYVAVIPEDSIDLFGFEALVEQGRTALRDGEAERALSFLTPAMELWRGPALADVHAGRLLQAQVTRLEERRLRALEMRIEADGLSGRHRELISELKALTSAHPYHENFHHHLMLALYRSGRQCEALDVYQGLREILVSQLGLEPSGDLRRLQHAVLAADPALDFVPPRAHVTEHAVVKPPAQLPPDIADFTGRDALVDRLARGLATRSSEAGAQAAVVAITGMPGVGKTAMAVHAAHAAREQFPDGQLFAQLREPTSQPVAPSLVLAHFLRAIGVRDDELPAETAARAEMFRSWAAPRRILVLLDDAVSAAQVRPLLPGGQHCGALITSRTELWDLEDTRDDVVVGASEPDESIRMLANIIGMQRVDRESEAAAEIVRLCGHLPLAVRAVGARLAAVPSRSLERFRTQLLDERRRLDELGSADFDLRNELQASYCSLGEQEQSALRWLSLLLDDTLTARRAAVLLGKEHDDVEPLLETLAKEHFLQRMGQDGTGQTYYRFFELARVLVRNSVVTGLADALRVC